MGRKSSEKSFGDVSRRAANCRIGRGNHRFMFKSIINFDEYDDRHTWDDVTDEGYITNHNPDGYNMYGIEVMVHPGYRRMKVGQRLYEARKELARELNLKSIILGGRIPNYHKYCRRNVSA